MPYEPLTCQTTGQVVNYAAMGDPIAVLGTNPLRTWFTIVAISFGDLFISPRNPVQSGAGLRITSSQPAIELHTSIHGLIVCAEWYMTGPGIGTVYILEGTSDNEMVAIRDRQESRALFMQADSGEFRNPNKSQR